MTDLHEMAEAQRRADGLCRGCNGNRRYTVAGTTIYCTVCQQPDFIREADLISRAAVYHAVKMVRQGPLRPAPSDRLSAWLMGRKPV